MSRWMTWWACRWAKPCREQTVSVITDRSTKRSNNPIFSVVPMNSGSFYVRVCTNPENLPGDVGNPVLLQRVAFSVLDQICYGTSATELHHQLQEWTGPMWGGYASNRSYLCGFLKLPPALIRLHRSKYKRAREHRVANVFCFGVYWGCRLEEVNQVMKAAVKTSTVLCVELGAMSPLWKQQICRVIKEGISPPTNQTAVNLSCCGCLRPP